MAEQQNLTSDFVKWKCSWTFAYRLGLLVIFTLLFLHFAITSSSSIEEVYDVDSDLLEEEESLEDTAEQEEVDSGGKSQYAQEDADEEEFESSAEEDRNYEDELEDVLNSREALDNNESFTEQDEGESEKPSFMFSIPALKELVTSEVMLHRAMTTYLFRVESRLEKMKRWVKDYEESTVKALSQIVKSRKPEPVVMNPFVNHRMIRRFSKDLQDITDLVNPQLEQSLLEEAAEVASEFPYPDVEEDYVDSLDSLLRIQHYNNYTTHDMQTGKLGHQETHITLDCVHAFDLAVHSHFHLRPNKIRTLGIEWMEMALKLFQEEGIVDDKFKDNMTATLELMVKSHDDNWEGIRYNESEWIFDDKIGSNFGSHLPQRPRYRRDFEAMLNRSDEGYSVHTRSNFRTLCSGKNLQTEAEKAKLTCWYDHKTHPYWTINPIKKEALSLNPELYQMYDILSPGAIKYLIDRAAPAMQRSLVISATDSNTNDKSTSRTSSQTWLFEYDFEPKLTEIFKRIEYSSGFKLVKVPFSQPLQVANYGGSHHYDEHLDVPIGADLRRIRDSAYRIVTYMFYLTNVEVGGKTAFPVMGTAATPVAGSAVMWYNVRRNGVPDERTYHGGCPVVYGEKWIANRWILALESWKKRPCSLNSEE